MESLEGKKTFTEIAKVLNPEKTGIDAYELEVFIGLREWRDTYSKQIATALNSDEDDVFSDEEYNVIYQFLLNTYSKIEDLTVEEYAGRTVDAILRGEASLEDLTNNPNDARWDILF